jgi:hypothetical protein
LNHKKAALTPPVPGNLPRLLIYTQKWFPLLRIML